MIIEETIELVKERLGGLNVRVEGVSVGLFYAGVAVRSSRGLHGGVAYVFRNNPLCSPIRSAGSLHKLDPLALAELSLSSNLTEASVGVAALNALSQLAVEGNPKYKPEAVDVADVVGKGESVAMVGYMEPVIRKLLAKECSVVVLEKARIDNPIVPTFPPQNAEEHLEKADVVIITGSTLINKTIDEILGLKLGAREIVVAGPTASIIPDALFEHGATAVMGVTITEPREMLRVVSQGGGAQQLLSTCAQKKAYFKRPWKE